MFTESLQTNLPHIQTIQVIHFKNYINHYPGERGRRNMEKIIKVLLVSALMINTGKFSTSSPLTRIRTLTSRPVCSLRHPVLQLRLQDSQRWRAGGTPWRRLEILLRLRQSKRHRDRLQSALRLLCFHEGIDRQVSTIPLNVWWHDDMWCSESTRPQAPTPPNWSRNTAAGLTWERWRGDITTAVNTQTPAST